MEVPPEITFRGLEKRNDIESLILDKTAKLDEIHGGLVSCRVAVEKDPAHQRSGSPYRVRVDVRIPPGKELVASREPGEGDANQQLKTVVNEAFDAVRRQLVKEKEKQQGEVKSHPKQALVGYVLRLFPEQGYGFIKTEDGRELYFHQNAVLSGDFQRLEIGTGVRYFPEEGNQGPQASTVQIVDKPGARASDTPPPEGAPPKGWT